MKLLITTCAPDDAERILRALLEERMVGCGNCLPGVRSLYWWQDAIEDEEETMLWMETPSERCEAAVASLRRLHPYDVPKILVLDPIDSDPDYRRWLARVTRPPRSDTED